MSEQKQPDRSPERHEPTRDELRERINRGLSVSIAEACVAIGAEITEPQPPRKSAIEFQPTGNTATHL